MPWFINDVYEPYRYCYFKHHCCIISTVSKSETINSKHWFDWNKDNIIKHENLSPYIKMGKEILTFGDIEIEKSFLLPQKF